MDIATYYDELPMLMIALFLFSELLDVRIRACIVAAVRIQCLPTEMLHASRACAKMSQRTRGGLTGSRLAGLFGQVPVMETMSSRHTAWEHHGFKAGASTLTCASYVDNLYAVSHSANGAVAILKDFRQHIGDRWGLSIKAESCTCMPAFGSPEFDAEDIDGWRVVTTFEALGHILNCDGDAKPCWEHTKAAMWRAFWGNCAATGSRRAPALHKFKLLQRCVQPAFTYRCPRWPYGKHLANTVDRVHRRMAAIIIRTPRVPSDTDASFVKRRNKIAAAHCRKAGSWSCLWRQRVLSWEQHVQ